MNRFFLLLSTVLVSVSAFARQGGSGDDALYRRFFKEAECDRRAFDLALRGHRILQEEGILARPQYLTIIDFTRPSNQKRLFVLDLEEEELVLASVTAHGVGSDPDSTTIPRLFGNTDGSRKSSAGFYLTGATYTNHRPLDSLGLCLFGLDKGFNDSAAVREIVIHYGATEYAGRVYVTDSGAARSFGCPALPLSTNTAVINKIKGGSCLFIYSDRVKDYPARSSVLNDRLRYPIVQQGPPPNNCRCRIEKPR